MNTLTAIPAMAPMFMGIGETNETMSAMSVIMISGMTISTAITLAFIPVYYSVIDNLSRVFRGKDKSGKKPPAEWYEYHTGGGSSIRGRILLL